MKKPPGFPAVVANDARQTKTHSSLIKPGYLSLLP